MSSTATRRVRVTPIAAYIITERLVFGPYANFFLPKARQAQLRCSALLRWHANMCTASKQQLVDTEVKVDVCTLMCELAEERGNILHRLEVEVFRGECSWVVLIEPFYLWSRLSPLWIHPKAAQETNSFPLGGGGKQQWEGRRFITECRHQEIPRSFVPIVLFSAVKPGGWSGALWGHYTKITKKTPAPVMGAARKIKKKRKKLKCRFADCQISHSCVQPEGGKWREETEIFIEYVGHWAPACFKS